MTGADRTSETTVVELAPDDAVAVRLQPRWTLILGLVLVVATLGAALAVLGHEGSSEDPADDAARVAAFQAAMVERHSFAYELDMSAEDVVGEDLEDLVPGGPLDVLQIDGEVAAEDRFAMVVTVPEGVQELVRVGDDLFERGTTMGDGETWSRGVYVEPEDPSFDDIRDGLEPEAGMDEPDARLITISRIYLERVIIDPAQLPSLLADIEPEVADAEADDLDGEVAAVGRVPFPESYSELLPDVAPMAATVQLGSDGDPSAARFEIRDAGGAVIIELRFSEWGGEFEVVSPDGAEEKESFTEVGTAIEGADDADPPTGDDDSEPAAQDGPRDLDPALAVWLPTKLPPDFELVDLAAADESGDDGCNGVFAIWMAQGRPAADWVRQDTPESDNSQLLTVRSVPADCHFVERTPLFEPGPFGDVPARRIGDQWEVLLDDTWVVRFDSVVVTWDELASMVSSLDLVTLASLQRQLDD